MIKVISFKDEEILTVDHNRWNEFYYRLLGPDGCNFRKDEDGKPIWNCKSDMSSATKILNTMPEIDLIKTLEYFEEEGGYCDCEILFNIDHSKGLLAEIMNWKNNQ